MTADKVKLLCLIILIVIFVAIVVTGIILKKYTLRRLDDIDGANGVIKKGDCKGNALTFASADSTANNVVYSNNDSKSTDSKSKKDVLSDESTDSESKEK